MYGDLHKPASVLRIPGGLGCPDRKWRWKFICFVLSCRTKTVVQWEGAPPPWLSFPDAFHLTASRQQCQCAIGFPFPPFQTPALEMAFDFRLWHFLSYFLESNNACRHCYGGEKDLGSRRSGYFFFFFFFFHSSFRRVIFNTFALCCSRVNDNLIQQTFIEFLSPTQSVSHKEEKIFSPLDLSIQ